MASAFSEWCCATSLGCCGQLIFLCCLFLVYHLMLNKMVVENVHTAAHAIFFNREDKIVK